jgi:hypothetical protein
MNHDLPKGADEREVVTAFFAKFGATVDLRAPTMVMQPTYDPSIS